CVLRVERCLIPLREKAFASGRTRMIRQAIRRVDAVGSSRIASAIVLAATAPGLLANVPANSVPTAATVGSFTISSVGDLINAEPLDIERDAEARKLAEILRASDA